MGLRCNLWRMILDPNDEFIPLTVSLWSYEKNSGIRKSESVCVCVCPYTGVTD
ncbi:unnamed protein product, partial [Didymodactylos carnosus]